MSHTSCDREAVVQQALDDDRWTESLRRHVASCPHCTDLVLVATSLRQHAESVEVTTQLPDSGYIWWRAQLQARAAAAEGATRVISLVQMVAIACSGGAMVFLLGRMWPQLKQWLVALKPESVHSPLPVDMAQPWLVIVASLAVLAFLVMFDASERRLED